MQTPVDELRLEAIADLHGIATALFVPFSVERLRGDPAAAETMLTVTLRGIDRAETVDRKLRLSWAAESILQQPPGVQPNTVTEWAALGVASGLVWLYTGLRVRAVATPGDRFDFWATDGIRHYGLEVSGTMRDDVEGRHREKVRQLLDNPYGVDGYVITVGFATRTAIFSFNRFAGDDQ